MWLISTSTEGTSPDEGAASGDTGWWRRVSSPHTFRSARWPGRDDQDGEVGFFAAGLLAVARLASIAAAAVLQSDTAVGGPSWLLIGLFTYAFARAAIRREPPLAAAFDVVLAALASALTGGMVGPYLVFSLVVSIGAGLTLGAGTGSLAGVVLGLVAVIVPASGLGGTSMAPLREMLAIAVLHPAVALAGALYQRSGKRARPSAQVLTDTRRALYSLHRLATQAPRSLDVPNVISNAQEEMRASLGAISGAALIDVDGELRVFGAFGVDGAEPVRGAPLDVLEDRLPVGQTRTVELLDADGRLGLLVCVRPGARAWSWAHRRRFRAIGSRTSVALGNALAFQRITQVSANDERRRIARDLHDGVAQSLAHLRFELDLLQRSIARGTAVEAERLGPLVDLAGHTVGEVRSLIGGLRAVTEPGGLAPALQRHVSHLQANTASPEIRLSVVGEGTFDADIESQIFRIGQEALSNAIRHAGARRVHCRVRLGGDGIDLTVSDDGIGIAEDHPVGVGLTAMGERAGGIGAQLTIRPRPYGGTVVDLTWRADEEPDR